MSYATDFLEHIKALGLNSFTHRDILINTTANCSYSVLPDIKLLLNREGKQLIKKEEINPKNKKRYTRYFIEVL